VPDEVAVPCKEICGGVDVHGHVDVSSDIFVVTRLDSGVVFGLVCTHVLGRCLHQASSGIGKGLAVFIRHVAELLSHFRIAILA